MLVLAVVRKVAETNFNLHIIFKAIYIHIILFKLTGDFSFLMPILGLLKGCGSCNPCPICTIVQTRKGTEQKQWLESDEVNLHTIGRLYEDYACWVMEGKKLSAVATHKLNSVCGSPLLPITKGRTYDIYLLTIVVDGPLHLFLSMNEIINCVDKNTYAKL